MVYTSAVELACERSTWTNENNTNITAYVESSNGCCMTISNFVAPSPTNYEYDITPETAGCGITETQSVSMKLVETTGVGDDLCLIMSICRAARHGLLVMCVQQVQQASLGSVLSLILDVLAGLVNILLNPLPVLQPVNQNGCIFSNTCVA